MGSVNNVQTPKQHFFHFPPSPPSSATVTASSSPRLHAIGYGESEIVDNIFPGQLPFRRANSQSVSSWRAHATDSDGSTTETRQELQRPPVRRYTRRQAIRALTLPSSRFSTASNLPPATPAPKPSRRPTSRSSSYKTSSSSSSPSPTDEQPPQHVPNSGIGRKVAASLQLFKESTVGPSDEAKPREYARQEHSRPESSSSRRRATSSQKEENVSEAQFEFVKRSEWSDREAAAFRREKSSVTLDRARTRDSLSSGASDIELSRERERKLSIRDAVLGDLVQWRRDVTLRQDGGRGRRRERSTDEPLFEHELERALISSSSSSFFTNTLPSPFRRSGSHTYPLSPSPSRSPSNRIPPLSLSIPSDTDRDSSPSETSSLRSTPRSRSPTPIQATSPFPLRLPSPSRPLTPTEPLSPWSTDDESAWETASATTSTSTTSASSPFPFPGSHTSIYPSHDEGEELGPQGFLRLSNGTEATDRALDEEDGYLDFEINLSQEHLPHIPLRPFRNQVGGHSAIYKFTKRAVCKPLVSRENLFYESVEREAPPLLGFIPRYLGVMLVSYRRVPKGSNSPPVPHSDSDHRTSEPLSLSPPRPPLHKSVSVDVHPNSVPSTSSEQKKISEEEEGDTDRGEAEMPEVVLDRNRHIIPEWMLRGGRSRAYSQSYVTGSLKPINRQLKRLHLNGQTASSPNLGQPAGLRTPQPQRASLARYHPLVAAEIDAPTPANSPRLSKRILSLPSSYGDQSDSRFLHPEDQLCARPGLRPFHSERAMQSTPAWFGGTGSTMVNTKLKDHVFSTVLRRFRKRCGRCHPDVRTEDEGDIADAEGDDAELDHPMPRLGRRNKRLQQRESNEREPVRRVQSESLISPKRLGEKEWNDGHGDVFDFEYDKDKSHGDSNVLDNVLSPSIARRRSRSRSLDLSSQPYPAPVQPIAEDPTVTRQNHFILMEDLTGRLKHSCVMDLKMGTRQYGIDATSAKKKSQRKKCDRTTSRSLGVRVCGMQVWNHVTQSYVTQDKYMGREVQPEEFPSVLASFLWDGEQLLAYQIPILLQKIYALARIINRLKGYRFYGCSLLLIYDGDREAQDAFRSLALEHPSARSKRGESLERQSSRTRSGSKHRKPSLRRSHSEDLLLGPVGKRSGGRRKRGEINVRIVDFAHTTTGRDWLTYPPDRPAGQDLSSPKGYQPEVDPDTGLVYARFPPHYPDQPDRGFLFGLKNLASTLEKIWNDERIRRIKLSRGDPSVVASQLTPLPADGKEIFDEIFGPTREDPGELST